MKKTRVQKSHASVPLRRVWYYSGRKLPKSFLCLVVKEHVIKHVALAAVLAQGAAFNPASPDLRQEEGWLAINAMMQIHINIIAPGFSLT